MVGNTCNPTAWGAEPGGLPKPEVSPVYGESVSERGELDFEKLTFKMKYKFWNL